METNGREGLAAAFERLVNDFPHVPEFRGIELVSATAKRLRNGFELEVVVDREGGVDVASCERIAARINGALDTYPEPYTLSVESAGLSRPLVRPQDYQRFAGADVKIVTTLTIERAKTHRGRLAGLRGEAVVLERPQGELLIPLEAIKTANIEYDIRADLAREKRERKQKT